MLHRLISLILLFVCPLLAGEGLFFITYTHQMEEPGNLELGAATTTGKPSGANRFFGMTTELEYGVRAWWTTELYLEGQSTRNDSAVFTGFRWENRFRLLEREHWINPVLYLEIENINGANRSLLEVVGHDGEDDLTGRNADTRLEKKRELEAKLILSSHVRGWTIAGNFIAEKNVRHQPFEFGYAVAFSRPLALAARSENCRVCPENFQAGVELYGGLGTHHSFGLRDTAQYIAPTLSWTVADGPTLKVSPSFGLTGRSAGLLLRFGVSYEIAQFRRLWRK